jgi:outer membrane protein OmpA-like peptidoglycan-associated protein
MRVAPTVGSEFNAIKAAIFPFACFRVDDVRFEFDSSIVKPDLADELAELAKLVKDHTRNGVRPPASVFGHADPVGNDDYNKQLSGRRAIAIYAMLTRDVDKWEELFTKPHGGDSWEQKKAVPMMLGALGFGATAAEVRQFQQSRGLAPDGAVGPQTRKALYRAYMDAICPLTLDKKEFLGRGQDPDGKADVQGCGEFNPVLLFSQSENATLSQPANHPKRNDQNAPNRRVMIFLFRPGTRVDPQRWPCPRAKEGVAGCKKRFWSDGEQRRSFQAARREFKDTQDTFACRFYQRLSDKSPCEGVLQRFVFRYLLPVGEELPWDDETKIRFISEDQSHQRSFEFASGREVEGFREFVFSDARAGLKYRGEAVRGDTVIDLFDPVEIARVQDPADDLNQLPIPDEDPAAETTGAGGGPSPEAQAFEDLDEPADPQIDREVRQAFA